MFINSLSSLSYHHYYEYYQQHYHKYHHYSYSYIYCHYHEYPHPNPEPKSPSHHPYHPYHPHHPHHLYHPHSPWSTPMGSPQVSQYSANMASKQWRQKGRPSRMMYLWPPSWRSHSKQAKCFMCHALPSASVHSSARMICGGGGA